MAPDAWPGRKEAQRCLSGTGLPATQGALLLPGMMKRLPRSTLAPVVQASAGSASAGEGLRRCVAPFADPFIGSQAGRAGLDPGSPKTKMALEPGHLI